MAASFPFAAGGVAAAMPAWAWPLGGGVLGAIVGSFVATLVVRWSRGEAVSGRSRCDGCARPLGPAALVPLLSYVILGGRCRACGARIDRRHPAIEAAAVAIGGLALALAPSPAGAAGAAFGWLLLAPAALDLGLLWLPDALTAALAAGGLAGGLAGLPPPLADRLIGGAAGYVTLALIGQGYARLRGRTGLGRGDPKLLGAIGLWLGWRALPLVVLGASLAGLAFVAVRAAAGRPPAATDKLPLGALMAAAGWGCWCGAALGLLPNACTG